MIQIVKYSEIVVAMSWQGQPHRSIMPTILKGRRLRMNRKLLTFGLLAALAISLLAPGISAAKDYCVSFTSSPPFAFVGQSFTLPAKGKCKTWTGFFNTGGNLPTTGTG